MLELGRLNNVYSYKLFDLIFTSSPPSLISFSLFITYASPILHLILLLSPLPLPPPPSSSSSSPPPPLPPPPLPPPPIFTFHLYIRALKRDVTRLGKRTKQGAFDDGVNSAMRYFINNYQDETRQKGIDILLGYATIDGEQSKVRTHGHVETCTDMHRYAHF